MSFGNILTIYSQAADPVPPVAYTKPVPTAEMGAMINILNFNHCPYKIIDSTIFFNTANRMLTEDIVDAIKLTGYKFTFLMIDDAGGSRFWSSALPPGMEDDIVNILAI